MLCGYCNVLFGKIQQAIIGHIYSKVKGHHIRLHTKFYR